MRQIPVLTMTCGNFAKNIASTDGRSVLTRSSFSFATDGEHVPLRQSSIPVYPICHTADAPVRSTVFFVDSWRASPQRQQSIPVHPSPNDSPNVLFLTTEAKHLPFTLHHTTKPFNERRPLLTARNQCLLPRVRYR